MSVRAKRHGAVHNFCCLLATITIHHGASWSCDYERTGQRGRSIRRSSFGLAINSELENRPRLRTWPDQSCCSIFGIFGLDMNVMSSNINFDLNAFSTHHPSVLW